MLPGCVTEVYNGYRDSRHAGCRVCRLATADVQKFLDFPALLRSGCAERALSRNVWCLAGLKLLVTSVVKIGCCSACRRLIKSSVLTGGV